MRVCPVAVFEVRRIDEAEFDALGVLGRLRSRAHRRMTAYAVRAGDCTGCGACVTACPEAAIEIVRPAS
jgi:NAD-dependent dihydropyrimidine dehydrogenase PreA subunit